MRVEELMTKNVACCTPQTSLQDVARMMRDNDCGEIPVVESEKSRKLAGVITDRDIVIRTIAANRDPMQLKASDAMTTQLWTVKPDTDLNECRNVMESHQIRRVPVTDEKGTICGIVAQADIARQADEHATAEVVRDVSRPAGGGQQQAMLH